MSSSAPCGGDHKGLLCSFVFSACRCGIYCFRDSRLRKNAEPVQTPVASGLHPGIHLEEIPNEALQGDLRDKR